MIMHFTPNVSKWTSDNGPFVYLCIFFVFVVFVVFGVYTQDLLMVVHCIVIQLASFFCVRLKLTATTALLTQLFPVAYKM